MSSARRSLLAWIYFYYSPAAPDPKNVLSRFTMNGNTLDPASEKVLLEVGTQRDLCCHVGGDIGFDSKGNLFLSTGDNTNSWASDGYSPIDERPGHGPFDAQKSSANTNHLRGKLIRITPQDDGTYTIPQGNLFPPGTEKTARRSTTRVCATRSGSLWTRRPTRCGWVWSARMPVRTTRNVGRDSTRKSYISPNRATAAGRTASPTTSRTTTSTSPPALPAPPSTARTW